MPHTRTFPVRFFNPHRSNRKDLHMLSSKLSRRSFVQLAGATALVATSGAIAPSNAFGMDVSDWDAIVEAARGSKVAWYGWGGSAPRNELITNTLAPRLKEKYDIELELVGMDINNILTQLSGEFQAGLTEDGGSIDFIWINGENFASAKANGYLWGPFAQDLPNVQNYVDTEAADIAYDFGTPVEGYEAPYGKAQMVFWVDSAQVPETETPIDSETFLQFCQDHPGMVTYPEPGDFTGTAIISCLIAGVVGKEEFEKLATMTEPSEDEVRAIVAPGMEYLRSLNPHLWKQGKTFPADSTTMHQMYADGELIMDAGYGEPQTDVDNGLLPATTRSFVLDTGTVGNTNYMAIAANAPHKEAAMVAINEVLSPDYQLARYKTLGNITVLDLDRLCEEDRAAFDAVELGSAQLPLDVKLEHAVAEACGPVIPVLEKIWHDEVPGK